MKKGRLDGKKLGLTEKEGEGEWMEGQREHETEGRIGGKGRRAKG